VPSARSQGLAQSNNVPDPRGPGQGPFKFAWVGNGQRRTIQRRSCHIEVSDA
jgi:hypothetical protein